MSKNTRNRILLTAVAALLLVTLTIGGTLAWLTSTPDEVTNTFTTANVSITLKEHQLQEDGSVNTTEVNTNEYQLIPDTTMAKDPFVKVNTGSEDCWVFVEIVEKGNADKYLNWTVNNNEWELMSALSSGKGGKVYAHKGTMSAEDISYILTGEKYANGEITVDAEEVTSTTMAQADLAELVFYAYACQEANVNTAADAWAILFPTT